MPNRKQIWVTPINGEYTVSRNNSARYIEKFSLKEEAMNFAKKLCEKGFELRYGVYTGANNYAGNPFPPRY